jgi:hypothetical protein
VFARDKSLADIEDDLANRWIITETGYGVYVFEATANGTRAALTLSTTGVTWPSVATASVPVNTTQALWEFENNGGQELSATLQGFVTLTGQGRRCFINIPVTLKRGITWTS